MSDGWVKLHRKILRDWVSEKPQTLAVWIHLLCLAQHSSRTTFAGNKKLEIHAGQFVTGRRKLATQIGVSESVLERILDNLSSDGKIEQQKTQHYRIISICNWEKFQNTNNKRTANETPDETADETTNSTESGHYKKKGRSKEVKNNKGRKSRGQQKRVILSQLIFPAGWDKNQTIEVLTEYMEHRAAIGAKALPLKSYQAHLDDFAGFGLESLRASVRETIKRGWIGIFPIQRNGQREEPPQKKFTEMMREWRGEQKNNKQS